MLNLPMQRPGGVQTMPVGGFNLDDCPAWATLGTHSSMDSEGTTFTSSAGNSRSLLASAPPGPINQPPRSVPLDASAPRSAPADTGINDRPQPTHFPPAMPPRSQPQKATEEEKPVLLQWFPKDSQALAAGAWSNLGSAPPRSVTRSISPVPNSSRTPSQGSVTPNFVTCKSQPEQPENRGPQPEATVRPAADLNAMTRGGNSASQSGFRGVDGIVQWFNLATQPRPGFNPNESAPPGRTPLQGRVRAPANVGQKRRPSNAN